MKKFLLVLSIGAFAACNNSTAPDASKDSAAKMSADTTAKMADTSAKMAMDTAKKALDTAKKALDSAAKK